MINSSTPTQTQIVSCQNFQPILVDRRREVIRNETPRQWWRFNAYSTSTPDMILLIWTHIMIIASSLAQRRRGWGGGSVGPLHCPFLIWYCHTHNISWLSFALVLHYFACSLVLVSLVVVCPCHCHIILIVPAGPKILSSGWVHHLSWGYLCTQIFASLFFRLFVRLVTKVRHWSLQADSKEIILI